MTTTKFAVPNTHPYFKTLEEIQESHSNEEVVEMVNRFIDSQMTAKKSRLKRQEKEKAVRNKIAELARSEGLTVEEYLARQ